MRRKMPACVLELLAIPGLKPHTIMKLHTLLDVNSLEDLAAACSRGAVAATKGLGPALERKILQGIAIAREGEGRLRMNQAQAILEQAIAELKRLRPDLRNITIAGDLRRACELVSDLRLVAVDPEAKVVEEASFGGLTLHTCPPARFGAVLLHATGSEATSKSLLRSRARKRSRLTLMAFGGPAI